MSSITLMAKPSWFDCSNQIWTISMQPLTDHLHPILGSMGTSNRLRSMWLLSFVQDMGTFRSKSPELFLHGLAHYPSIHDALLVLKIDLNQSKAPSELEDGCSQGESTRLACLFFICVLLQAAVSTPEIPPGLTSGLGTMGSLNAFLDDNRNEWQDSIDDLYATLFRNFAESREMVAKTDYVLNMTNVIGTMAYKVRRGVERCLVHILCPSGGEVNQAHAAEWSPDLLLSSILS